MGTELIAEPLWLLIDADDTLWESNIFFEEAIAEFTTYVDHSELTPAEVRAELDRIETRNGKKNGYGTENFINNLVQCYESLHDQPADPEDRHRLRGITDRI